MNHGLLIGVSLLAIIAGLVLTNIRINYVHKRINTMATRRKAIRRSLRERFMPEDRLAAIEAAILRHPSSKGKKLKVVK